MQVARLAFLSNPTGLVCHHATACIYPVVLMTSNTVFQIKKSSSSVFANISKAQYAQSLPDILSKFKIARKECVENESWLKLLFSNSAIDEITFKKHGNLCGRTQSLLTSSCITIVNKITHK